MDDKFWHQFTHFVHVNLRTYLFVLQTFVSIGPTRWYFIYCYSTANLV